MITKRLGG
uniref:Uncharacterized protein n=1 Tax=Vitis vinifera TaxID=29760 RepID=F6H4L7_VITVI